MRNEHVSMGLAVDVPSEVFGWPAKFEQRLFEVAPFAGMHHDRVVVQACAEHPRHPFGADHLLQHGAVGGRQDQPVRGVLLQPQPAIARHRLGDVDEQRVWHRIARVRE